MNNIENINFGTAGPKPIYFDGQIDFGDVISMTAGVQIFGRAGNDIFWGGNLGETVEGDWGNDELHGLAGDDTLYGDTINNPWAVSWAAAGNDMLYGGAGNDILNGQGGNDELYGGADTDLLYGGDGNDLLDGGLGFNGLSGGAGIDTFQFTAPAETSTIYDFQLSTDRLRFDISVADDFSDLSIVDDINGDAHVMVGGVDITLLGVSASSINSSYVDFGVYA